MVRSRLRDVSLVAAILVITGCDAPEPPAQDAAASSPAAAITISRADYRDRLEGFWLGQCIANWTGLVTEMDKIGGEGSAGRFYTRDDWGEPDQPNIWSGEVSPLSPTIDWVFESADGEVIDAFDVSAPLAHANWPAAIAEATANRR